MQIVIDMSENDYRKVQDGRASVSMMLKTIRNGTPLDKIRADIEQVANQEKFYDEKWALGLRHAISIIDKYKGESEDAE